MSNTSNRGFVYHAYGLGISGQLGDKIIEPQAASALPPAGGRGSSQWSNYQLQDTVKYDFAGSSTEGTDRIKDHHVVTKAAVKNLQIGSLVKIADISVQLEVSHDNFADVAPRFNLNTDTTFLRNVTVAGRPIRLVPVFPKPNMSTAEARAMYDDIMAQVRSSAPGEPGPVDVVTAVRKVFAWFRHEFKKGEPPVYNDTTVLPLFRIETPSEPGRFIVHGNLIRVPGSGYVQLGQLIVRRDEWRVTMVQVHLGDIAPQPAPGPRLPGVSGGSFGGEMSCASVGSNGGHTDPPTS